MNRLRKIAKAASMGAVVMGTGAMGALTLWRSARNLAPETQQKLGVHLYKQIADLVSKTAKLVEGDVDCKDCGEYGYGFMLHDEIWASALSPDELAEYPIGVSPDPGKKGLYVCLACCEKRLDRPIGPDDVNYDAAINRPLLHAMRSRSAMSLTLKNLVEHAEAADQCRICHEDLDKPADGETRTTAHVTRHTVDCPVAKAIDLIAEAEPFRIGSITKTLIAPPIPVGGS